MFVASFAKKSYLTLKLTFDLELWQNKSRYQKRPLHKISHLVQVAFVPSGIILLQNAVGMSLTCPLYLVFSRKTLSLGKGGRGGGGGAVCRQRLLRRSTWSVIMNRL